MSDFWWQLLAAAVLAFAAYEIVQGWRTGRMSGRGLHGDRKEAPGRYWLLMGFNVILIIVCLFVIHSIYGEPH